ncbi:MAG: IucA/IucC family C-terminal-domain containing protein [bacterium]
MVKQRSRKDVLEDRFLITGDTREDVSREVDRDSLMEPKHLEEFLEWYVRDMECPDRHTAASRFHFHMMRPMLRGPIFTLSIRNEVINWGPEQFLYQKHKNGEEGHEWGAKLSPLHVESIEKGDRKKARSAVYKQVFAGHFEPIFQSMKQITTIPLRTLWENLAHVLMVYVPKWNKEANGSSTRNRLESDLDYLCSATIKDWENQLSEPLKDLQTQLRNRGYFERTTCCLNYRLERYCESCPLTD